MSKYKLTEHPAHLGIAKGGTVRAKNAISDFGAGIKNLVGGEIVAYTKLMADAREQRAEPAGQERRPASDGKALSQRRPAADGLANGGWFHGAVLSWLACAGLHPAPAKPSYPAPRL